MGNTWVTAGNTVTKQRRRALADISHERNFMNDFWTFRKKYYEVKEDENYWNGVIQDSDALIRNYDCDLYFKDIVLSCVDDLERRYRQKFIGKDSRITFVPGTNGTGTFKRISSRHREGEKQ